MFLLAVLVCTAPARATWPSDPTQNLPVCTAAGDQEQVQLLADGHGGAWVAWSDGRVAFSSADIYAQHVLSSGAVDPAWPPDGLAISTGLSQALSPVLAPDGASGFFVAWFDPRTSAGNPDVYMHHVLSTGVVDPTWPANGDGVCTTLDYQYPPQILADGTGGAFVCFGDLAVNNNIFAQHVLASGALDPAWPAGGLGVCTQAGEQYFPSMVLDGAGGILLAWEDDRTDAGNIYAAHVSKSGVLDPAWPVNGLAVCTASAAQSSVRLVSDGLGNAIAVWSDHRNSTTADLYAQHVLATGAVDPAWPANGVAICTATGDQLIGRIVSDGAHGAVIAWQDKRNGDYDIYAHHLLASGNVDPAWPVNGRALCTAVGDQSIGGALVDGAGGALIAWQDARLGTTNRDIYATHVLSSGIADPTWPLNGRAVCTAVGDQLAPAACPDVAGGMLCAWSDHRGTSYDVYAQRVNADGTLDVGDAPTPAGPHIAAPRPNPAAFAMLLRFQLARSGPARLDVLDLAGRRVRRLSASLLDAGSHDVRWDLRDDTGQPVPDGIYFVTFALDGTTGTRRIAVVR
jgi:hypothetical protein